MLLSYATYQEACGKYTNLSKYLDVCVYVTSVCHDIIFLMEHNLGDVLRKAVLQGWDENFMVTGISHEQFRIHWFGSGQLNLTFPRSALFARRPMPEMRLWTSE